MPIIDLIQFRRGIASLWTSVNTLLSAGEPGFETDKYRLKVGNGTQPWNSLLYLAGSGVPAILGGTGISVFTGVGSVGSQYYNQPNVPFYVINNTGVISISGGSGISVSGSGGYYTITNTGIISISGGSGISVTESGGYYTITNTGVISISGGAGIEISGSGGHYTVINSGVVSISGGHGIEIESSGGYYTIINTGVIDIYPGSGIRIEHSNGYYTVINTGVISISGGDGISVSGSSGNYTVANIGVINILPGDGISVTGSDGDYTVTNTGVISITGGDGISVSGSDGHYSVTNTLPIISVTGGYGIKVTENSNIYAVEATGLSASGHTHTASNITDFDGAVSGLLPVKNIVGGSGINVSSTTGTYTISVTGISSLIGEEVDDRVAQLFVAGTGINLNYNDGSNSFTVSVTGLIANPTTNRILTSRDSTTTGIDAESNLMFDGSTLAVSGNITASGTIIGSDGQPHNRTLYFNGGNWASVSNWFVDSAKTTQASSIPTIEDTAIIDGNVSISSCSSGNIEAHTIIFRDTASISSAVPVLAEYIYLYDSSYLNNSFGVFGNTTESTIIKFYNDSYINGGSVSVMYFYGDVYFYDDADNYGSGFAYGINIYGNLYLNVNSGVSNGFEGGGSYNTVYGDVYISNNSSSLSTLLSYCIVYGSCHLSNYASAEDCVFYGGDLVLDNYSTLSSTNTIYQGNIKVFYYSALSGTVIFYDSVVRIDYYGSISSSATILLYGSSKLILNGYFNPSGAATITGDTDTSRVEIHKEFGNNGLHNSSNITCGTLALYGTSYLTSSTSLTVDRVEFHDLSYLSSASTLDIVVFYDKSYCLGNITIRNYIEFNNESYNISQTVYGDGSSNPIGIFNDNSYNDGILDSNFDTVTFNGSSRNTYAGNGVNGDAIFNDFAKNDNGTTVVDDAVFNDFSSNEGTISGDATFTGLSTNTGTVSGSLIYRNVPTLLTPSSISSNQNDYDPGYGDVLRLESVGGNYNITGLVLKDRYIITIINIGSSYNLILKNQDSNSTAANRFITPTGGDYTILPNGTITLVYDDVADRWIVTSAPIINSSYISDFNEAVDNRIGSGLFVAGTGTTNYVSKFSSSSGLTNSSIFDSGNRIGIGTTSPQQLVHISGNIPTVGNLLRLQNGNPSLRTFVDFRIGSTGNYEDHFFISRSGNDVFGIDTSNRGLFLGNFTQLATKQFQSYNNANAFIEMQQAASPASSANTRIGFISDANLIFLASYVERMRLTGAGNLGIGTSSPSARLHVNGSGIIASGLTVNGVFTASTGTITTLSTIPTYVSPSALASSQGNWNPGTGDIIRLSASTSGVNISGIVLGNEYTRVLINIGTTQNITLKHQAASATSGNRIITSTGGDHIIPPTGTVTILYDTIDSRWRVL